MTAAGLAAAVFILLLNIRSFTIFFSFLESPVVLLALLGYLAFCLRSGPQRFENPKYAFIAGMLVFLSAVSSAVGCLLLVIPYLLWNWINFGHLQTVSAWQKTASFSPLGSWNLISSWCLHQFIPRVQHILGLNGISPVLLLSGLLTAGTLALIYLLTGSRRRQIFEKLRFCPEFLLFVGLHTVFIALVAPQDAAASAWYWVPELLLVALVAGVGVPEFSCRRFSVVPVLVVLLAGLQLCIYPRLVQRKTMSWAKLEVAQFLRENTSPLACGVMFDSGVVSYFSQRDFTGLNGLIGDFRHAVLIKERNYLAVFERNRIDFMVLDTPATLLDGFRALAIYTTVMKTKFENFNEPPKPFMVYKGSYEELEDIWKVRYKGCR